MPCLEFLLADIYDDVVIWLHKKKGVCVFYQCNEHGDQSNLTPFREDRYSAILSGVYSVSKSLVGDHTLEFEL